MNHYFRKTIQNELPELLAKKVLRDVLKRLRRAKYYSMILDVSHSEKMFSTIDGKVTIQEQFIDFKTVDKSTGEELTDTIFTILKEWDVNIQDCQGQVMITVQI